MAHRKVDVDDIIGDEDQYTDEILASIPLQEQEQLSAQKSSDVRSFLSRFPKTNDSGDLQQALNTSLLNPPVGPEVDHLKTLALQNIFAVLSAARAADIPALVKTLSSDQIDTLVKYLYKGMASPVTFNASVLLSWHEKVVEVGGVGSISRCMAERNGV